MLRLIRMPFAAVLTVALVLLACVACTGKDAVDQSAGSEFRFVSATKVGQVIAESDRKAVGTMTANRIGGQPYSLAASRGKVVVVNFWASWCGPCKTETPQLDALSRQIGSQGIDFVGVDVKELHRDQALSFIADNKISYPIVWDEPGKTALQLGHIPSAGLPFTVIVDKQQRVAAVYLQVVTPGDLTPVLTSLAAE
jgi:thiol-disulfide isomerase/thioredoxin